MSIAENYNAQSPPTNLNDRTFLRPPGFRHPSGSLLPYSFDPIPGLAAGGLDV